jgi:hypothetical protein
MIASLAASQNLKTRSVSHCDLAIYIKNIYLKAKEKLWKLK